MFLVSLQHDWCRCFFFFAVRVWFESLHCSILMVTVCLQERIPIFLLKWNTLLCKEKYLFSRQITLKTRSIRPVNLSWRNESIQNTFLTFTARILEVPRRQKIFEYLSVLPSFNTFLYFSLSVDISKPINRNTPPHSTLPILLTSPHIQTRIPHGLIADVSSRGSSLQEHNIVPIGHRPTITAVLVTTK